MTANVVSGLGLPYLSEFSSTGRSSLPAKTDAQGLTPATERDSVKASGASSQFFPDLDNAKLADGILTQLFSTNVDMSSPGMLNALKAVQLLRSNSGASSSATQPKATVFKESVLSDLRQQIGLTSMAKALGTDLADGSGATAALGNIMLKGAGDPVASAKQELYDSVAAMLPAKVTPKLAKAISAEINGMPMLNTPAAVKAVAVEIKALIAAANAEASAPTASKAFETQVLKNASSITADGIVDAKEGRNLLASAMIATGDLEGAAKLAQQGAALPEGLSAGDESSGSADSGATGAATQTASGTGVTGAAAPTQPKGETDWKKLGIRSQDGWVFAPAAYYNAQNANNGLTMIANEMNRMVERDANGQPIIRQVADKDGNQWVAIKANTNADSMRVGLTIAYNTVVMENRSGYGNSTGSIEAFAAAAVEPAWVKNQNLLATKPVSSNFDSNGNDVGFDAVRQGYLSRSGQSVA